MHELDCRGLACPGPVLNVKNTLEKEAPAAIAVLVDNEAARQNVSRFLEHHNYQVCSEGEGNGVLVIGTKGEGAGFPETPLPTRPAKRREDGTKKIMVLITSDKMGHGDDGLGDMLLFNFIKTLKEMGPELWRVVFVNMGVSFTAEGSEAVPILQELAREGVQILACGACLAYFHILDKIQVGEVTNMLEIVTGMQEADSVITI
jgi:selenium metabolism protein YedF